jgi:hypothetical protein
MDEPVELVCYLKVVENFRHKELFKLRFFKVFISVSLNQLQNDGFDDGD